MLAACDSCEKVALVALLAEDPAACHATAEVARRLAMSEADARALLADCEASGVVGRRGDGTYGLAPAAEIRERAIALARLYAEDPATVLQLLSAQAIARVRSGAARIAAAERLGSAPARPTADAERDAGDG
jgi:hypothetical protein